MGTRTIRAISVLFGLSLMLTACDPSELMQLVSDRLVDQQAAAPDDGGGAETARNAADDTAEQPQKRRRARQAPARGEDAPAPTADEPAEKPAEKRAEGGGGSPAAVSAIEREIFDTLNATRTQAGLAKLSLSADISDGARAWSCDMARSGNFRHADLRAAGVNGENIAWGYRSAADVHEGWMNSAGHRRNRMSPDWTKYGVGVCEDSAGQRFYTERFR